MQKNILSDAQNRFWYSYKPSALSARFADVPYFDDYTTRDIQELSNNAFTAGARWAFRQSSALSPHIAQFIEIMLLLGLLEPTDEMVSTTSDGASNAPASAGTPGDQGKHRYGDLPAMYGNVPIPDGASVRNDA